MLPAHTLDLHTFLVFKHMFYHFDVKIWQLTVLPYQPLQELTHTTIQHGLLLIPTAVPGLVKYIQFDLHGFPMLCITSKHGKPSFFLHKP